MAERSIHEMEKEATGVAHREIAAPLAAAINVLNLATKLQANDSPVKTLSKAVIVRLLLLQRIQNDLRCCIILVEHGYSLQAASLAAGIFEGWVTLANLENEDDAVKWLLHSNENESFGRIRSLTKQALAKSVGDARNADTWYSQYQQLCMAKHLNPIVERSRGYTSKDKTIQFRPGPDTSELAIKFGWLSLERATRFALLALTIIAHSQETSEELYRELTEQHIALKELEDESIRRWPDNYIVDA